MASTIRNESQVLTDTQAQVNFSLSAGIHLLSRCRSMIQNTEVNEPDSELYKALFIMIQNPKGVESFLSQNIDSQHFIQQLFNEAKKQDDYYLFEVEAILNLKPLPFRQVLEMINPLFKEQLSRQLIGMIFETFLRKVIYKETKNLSNTLITHSIIDYMIAVLDPKPTERVANPYFGIGHFLVRLYEQLYKTIPDSTTLKSIYGADQHRFFRDLKPYLWMYGLKMNFFELSECAKNIFDSEPKYMISNTFDVVLVDLAALRLNNYLGLSLYTSDLDIFNECIRLLKPGGRMGVLIATQRLLSDHDPYGKFRKKIQTQAKIIKIVSLPTDAHAPETTKISVVFLQKFTIEEEQFYYQNPHLDYKLVYAAIEKVGKDSSGWDLYDSEQNDLLKLAKEYKNYLENGAITTQILLKETNASKLVNWSVDYLKNRISEKTNYPLKKLSELLIPNRNYIIVQDAILYKRVKVRLHNQGVELRDEVKGADINTKRQIKIEKGQLIVAKLNTMNGAVGLVPDTLHDAIVTSDFLTYTVKTDLILPQYLEFLIASQPFSRYLNSITTGFVMERLNQSLFLNIEIPIPILETQTKLCQNLIGLKHQMKEIKESFYNEQKVFEQKLFNN